MTGSPYLILLLSTISICNGAFLSVPCEDSCTFNFKGPGNPIVLQCEKEVLTEPAPGVCICENDRTRRRADAPFYRVELEGDRCTVGERGPCGESNGLVLSCRGGSECLEGRCRDRAQFGKTPLNFSCLDSQDCQPGLVCKFTAFQFRRRYTCVTPETPEYDLGTRGKRSYSLFLYSLPRFNAPNIGTGKDKATATDVQ